MVEEFFDEIAPGQSSKRGGVRLIPPLYNMVLEAGGYKLDVVCDINPFMHEVTEAGLFPVCNDFRREVTSHEHGQLFQVGM